MDSSEAVKYFFSLPYDYEPPQTEEEEEESEEEDEQADEVEPADLDSALWIDPELVSIAMACWPNLRPKP